MRFILEILAGDQKGQRFRVRDGLLIGRKDADVIIQDSKVSGRHARIELRPDGHFVLVDLGSANGIKVGGKRVREVRLIQGIEFMLGRVPLLVKLDTNESVDSEILIEPEPDESWQDILKTVFDRSPKESKGVKRDLAPFSPPFQMRFTRGIQAGTVWTIGYGPRDIGSGSVDLFLEEVGMPATCFRLLPHHQGVLLKAELANGVHINGRPAEAEFLRDGDMIQIKGTQIEIEFDRGP